jgi:hypothetical protein
MVYRNWSMAAFPTPLRQSSINALALATPVAGANCFSGVSGTSGRRGSIVFLPHKDDIAGSPREEF